MYPELEERMRNTAMRVKAEEIEKYNPFGRIMGRNYAYIFSHLSVT